MISPVIFLDMDGVLSDLNNGFRNHFGLSSDIERTGLFYKLLPKYVEDEMFFKQDKLENSEQLVEGLVSLKSQGHIKIAILTSVGVTRPSNVVNHQKRKWLEKNFPVLNDVPFCTTVSGGDKSTFASSTTCLIDDHYKNVNKFITAGGHGFTYTPHKINNALEYVETFINQLTLNP